MDTMMMNTTDNMTDTTMDTATDTTTTLAPVPTTKPNGKPYRLLYRQLMQLAADNKGVIEVESDAVKTLMGKQHYRLPTAMADLRQTLAIRTVRTGRKVTSYVFEAWTQ